MSDATIGRMDETVLTESLDALQDGYLSFCRLLGRESGVTLGQEPDIAWAMTPLPLRGFNRIIRVRLDADQADARIQEMQDRYQAAGVGPTWWIDAHSLPADVGGRLERMGLVSETEPAMRIESTAVPDLELPAGVTLSWAVDPEPLRAAMRLIAAGFGMPDRLGGALADLMAPIARPGSPARTVVARIDDEPVAAAQGILVGEAVAIFNVATLEAARGRGIGAAVTLAILRDAIERGARFGVLESSAMGHPVYRRIGFRDVASLQVYVSPES
jgi:GNAT superfamily N-acetyltransferase